MGEQLLNITRKLFILLRVRSSLVHKGEGSLSSAGPSPESCVESRINLSHLYHTCRFLVHSLIIIIVYYSDAEDYGGPRKEFFNLFLTEVREMLTEDDNELVYIKGHFDSQLYYVYGLITGTEV